MTPGASLPPYRQGVGAMIFNEQGHVFVGERADLPGAWQMPQGGIDAGEDPKTALFRELREEIGTDQVTILDEVPGWIRYDFPSHLSGSPWRNRFRGQEQKWFAARLKGGHELIRLDLHPPAEFARWRWVPFEELPGLIVAFKRPVYEQVMQAFRPLLPEWFPEVAALSRSSGSGGS